MHSTTVQRGSRAMRTAANALGAPYGHAIGSARPTYRCITVFCLPAAPSAGFNHLAKHRRPVGHAAPRYTCSGVR